MVEPPTALTIQAGNPAKSFATRQLPDVVRLSSQLIWEKASHSLLTNSSISTRGPASRTTTLMPFWANSLPSVPPPAPEPTITTTPSSLRSNFASMFPVPPTPFGDLGVFQPVDVVEAAMQVASMFG